MKILYWLWVRITRPLYWFRWYRWALYQRRLRAKPRTPIERVVTIYAHEFGDDAAGDGASLATAYHTVVRAMRDIPKDIQPGMQYRVDVTGLHKEKLPTDISQFASDEAERREREIQRLQKMLAEHDEETP